MLAESDRYPQAFVVGNNTLALQFHPETTLDIVRNWYAMVDPNKVDIRQLDAHNQLKFPQTVKRIRQFWEEYLDWIEYDMSSLPF